MSNNINVAIYIRISTDREEQQTSLQNQEELCMEMIENKNWNLFRTYVDKVSGRIYKRPEFNELINDMENGHIQYVIVKEGSRLARSVTTFERIRELSTRKNIHLISVDGELDTVSKGYECITQVGADAQKEAEKISKRVKNALRMQAKRGEFIGSIPPYGFTLENKKLYPRDDETVTIVRKIFRSYLNGKGARNIANELQLEGIPTPSMVSNKSNATANWCDNTIYGILDNEAYIGNLVQCVEETYMANEERKRKTKQKDSFIKSENTHEPIIKLELFESVQRLRVLKSKPGSKSQHHLFTSKLYCKDCGKQLVFKKDWKNGTYVCSTYKRKGAKHCSNHAVNENELMKMLANELSKFNKMQFDIFKQKAERKIKQITRNLEGQIAAKQFEVRTIENRLDTLEDEILDRPARKIEFMKMLEKQQQKLSLKEKEIIEIQDKINHIQSPEIEKKLHAKLMETFDFKKFDLMTVNMFISKIDVHEDKSLEVHYEFGEVNAS